MADSTLIEWSHHPVSGKGATWNPVTGCALESPGCTYCYAMKLAGTRLKHHPSRAGLTTLGKKGPVWTGEVRFNEAWLDLPLRWRAARGIFVCAHGDLFAAGVTDEMIDRVFAVMALCPQHVFFVLTKRPERMRDYLDKLTDAYHGNDQTFTQRLGDPAVEITNSPCAAGTVEENWPLPHVWLGTSVENQEWADKRIPILLTTPAAKRFISAEPLLGPVDIDCPSVDWMRFPEGNGIAGDRLMIDWVIAGGESGDNARPSHPDWFRNLRSQCAAASIPFFFKQWGSHGPVQICRAQFVNPLPEHVGERVVGPNGAFVGYPTGDYLTVMRRMQKAAAGRILDGVEHSAYPELCA